jgi:hypothetical protein
MLMVNHESELSYPVLAVKMIADFVNFDACA